MEPAGALAVRTRGGCSYKIATPGGKPVASGRGMVEACGLDVPGKRTPRGVAHLRYACVVCALTSASRCSPGRDEHQLVRGAAGGPAHRASRCATLFAPGAGAPTGLRHPGGGFTAAAVFRLTRPGADPPGSAVRAWGRDAVPCPADTGGSGRHRPAPGPRRDRDRPESAARVRY